MKLTYLFVLESSSFPLLTPKILVIKELKRRVDEFLTYYKNKHTIWVKEYLWHEINMYNGQLGIPIIIPLASVGLKKTWFVFTK